MKKRVSHPKIKTPSPHISGAVVCDGWVFVSGQGPLDMSSREVVRGSIEEETRLTLDNIGKILREAGCDFSDVVKCTCYIGDLDDFAGFDAVYREYFSRDVPPARTTSRADLLRGIKVEIDAIARLPHGAS